MIIAGAGSAGKETLAFYVSCHKVGIADLYKNNMHNAYFYDANNELGDYILGKYPVIKTETALVKAISKNPDFCVAIGQPRYRERMYKYLYKLGGVPQNIIKYNSVHIFSDIKENQADIIHPYVCISYDFEIGISCIIHANSVIGHKVKLGNFINVSPSCTILGPCEIGDYSYIGSNSTILPNHIIGRNVIIPAGSVVNRDMRDYETFE